jgi:conjugative transposon TraJ protein
MNSKKKAAFTAVLVMVLPLLSQAQTMGSEVDKLHTVLENLYNDMIPLCSQLISVARAIAGFAATFYIGYRVWRHIANAEPIDFFPLLRPFAIAIAIGIFPSVLGVINGVFKPTVTATEAMVDNSNASIKKLLAQREAAIKATKKWQVLVGESGGGDRKEWYKYTTGNDPASEGFFESIGNDLRFGLEQMEYNIRNFIKLAIATVLQILYYAASLCIDTIRTFHLVILAILGPLVFALSVFDGFQHTLSVWLARYINIYMWLPCANIFGSLLGKIQENMIKIDIGQLASNDDTFFTTTDLAYIIFMVIGIIGYFTIPSVANYIVHASGGSALLSKVNSTISTGTSGAGFGGNSFASFGAGSYAADGMTRNDQYRSSMTDAKNSEPYIKDNGSGYQHNRVAGS